MVVIRVVWGSDVDVDVHNDVVGFGKGVLSSELVVM